MPPLVILLVGVLGLCIGSFLNVVAYRVPLGRSVVRGRSHCPSCRATIVWYDDLPVLSWLLLRRRCRRCHAPISGWYPLGEMLAGVAFAVAAWLVPNAVVLGVVLMLVSGCIAAAGIARSRRP